MFGLLVYAVFVGLRKRARETERQREREIKRERQRERGLLLRYLHWLPMVDGVVVPGLVPAVPSDRSWVALLV